MKSREEQIQDLQEIKNLMERSSRFLSLSGLSGIFAGIFALIGAYIANYMILYNGSISVNPNFPIVDQIWAIKRDLFLTAMGVLLFASISFYFFSFKKAKRLKQKFWNKTTFKVLYNFLLPLISGGLFTILLIYNDSHQMVASATLIFYGIALINASKFMVSEIHFLGISEIILGIFAAIFLNFGILFWAIGFGVLHIIYGTVMYYKYEK